MLSLWQLWCKPYFGESWSWHSEGMCHNMNGCVCFSESINTWFHPSLAWLPLIIAEATWPVVSQRHNLAPMTVFYWNEKWPGMMSTAWESLTWGTWDTVVTRREHYTGTLSSLTWPHFYINYTNNIFPELALSHRKLIYKYSEFIKVTVSLAHGCGGMW